MMQITSVQHLASPFFKGGLRGFKLLICNPLSPPSKEGGSKKRAINGCTLTSAAAKQKGFTLLEVLIAITLTALVLGNLFALQSQSKRLSFKAQTNLHKNINQRAFLNAAWISDRPSDTYLDELSQQSDYSVDKPVALKKPDLETQPLNFSLESFAVVNQQQEMIFTSVRFIASDVARK